VIYPKQLVIETDVTNDVKELLKVTSQKIKEAFVILESTTIPDISPRYANQLVVKGVTWFKEWMSVFCHLNPDLDKYSIYNMIYLNQNQVALLEDRGITSIKDMPEELAQEKQLLQIDLIKSGERIILKDKIKKFLDSFQYPIYFLDYETLSSVIPFFDGMSPYKDYPFQYSLHVLDKLDSEVRHTEYLHLENSDPMPSLLKKLRKDIGDTGTIITWNMGYEKSCNEQMANMYPQYKEFLNQLNDRIVDLMTPFFEKWFVDKDFFGSSSLKVVLPVVIPELGYKGMDVSDGLEARRMWTQTVLEDKNQNNKDEIINDLLKYCELDTFAMVKIFELLRNL